MPAVKNPAAVTTISKRPITNKPRYLIGLPVTTFLWRPRETVERDHYLGVGTTFAKISSCYASLFLHRLATREFGLGAYISGVPFSLEIFCRGIKKQPSVRLVVRFLLAFAGESDPVALLVDELQLREPLNEAMDFLSVWFARFRGPSEAAREFGLCDAARLVLQRLQEQVLLIMLGRLHLLLGRIGERGSVDRRDELALGGFQFLMRDGVQPEIDRREIGPAEFCLQCRVATIPFMVMVRLPSTSAT